MPRVTINEGTRSRALIQPFTQPAKLPARIARSTATGTGTSQLSRAKPNTAPAKPSTEPTDRSIPAVMITRVMPAAMTVSVGIWLAKLEKVAAVKNRSLLSENRPTKAIQIRSRGA